MVQIGLIYTCDSCCNVYYGTKIALLLGWKSEKINGKKKHFCCPRCYAEYKEKELKNNEKD